MVSDDSGRDESTKSVGDSAAASDRPRIKELGHFTIEATLGSGGMGTIYRAYDRSMKRPVALKVLHSSLEISERAQSRFVREAWIAGQLDHPNIVKVHSRGEERNVSYLVMELAEGGSLYDFVQRTRESIPAGSDLTRTINQDFIKDILTRFIELAEALEHVHAKGFIHRDIKPHNVLLTGADKKFKLTDFGIAHAEDMTRMTRAGDFIGTVKYMSPELLAAHRAGIDRRTDVYSLGVTLYETLTLTLPFKADSEEKLIGEILAGHYTQARKSNRRIPVDLETVLMKACHHDPDQRYQTAAEFAEDLRRILVGRPVLARRQSAISKAVKYARRNRRAVFGVAVAAAIVTGGALLQYDRMRRAYDRAGLAGGQLALKPDFQKVSIPTQPYAGALSPDGTTIAYLSQGGVWTAPIRGNVDPNVAGAPVRLTGDLGAKISADDLCWSGDGKWIAFDAHPGLEQGVFDSAIYVVRSSGGEPRLVIRDEERVWYGPNHGMSLSPDGSVLAFSACGLESAAPKHVLASDCHVYTIPIAGGPAERLSEPGTGRPVFSSDGQRIAYVKGEYSSGRWVQNIWVIDVATRTPVQISNFSVEEIGSGWWQHGYIGASNPIWSPDGGWIAYAYDPGDINRNREIRVLRLSGEGAPDGNPLRYAPPYASFPDLIGWTFGNQIGLFMYPGGEAVYTVPASGGNATQLTPASSFTSPAWSRDGHRLFFAYNRTAASVSTSGGSISMLPIAAGTPLMLPWARSISLSPDGEQIAFAGKEAALTGQMLPGPGEYHIWIVSIRGGSVKQLTTADGFDDLVPCWSPDGMNIAFRRSPVEADPLRSSDDEPVNIFIVHVDGGEPLQLTSDADHVAQGGLVFSPDGESIAYASKDSTLKIISVRDRVSRTVLRADDPTVYDRETRFSGINDIAWSPDGGKLVFATNGRAWIVAPEGGQPELVTTGLDADIYHVAWSPDGESLALGAEKYSRPEFWLLENFLPPSQGTESESEPTRTAVQ